MTALVDALAQDKPLAPALGLRKRDATGLKRLARAQWETPDVAAMAAELATQVAPNDAEAHLLYGMALARGKFHQRASDALRRSLAIDKTSVAAWASLGEVLLEAMDYKAARAAFTEVMKLDPKAQDPYGRRARVVVAKSLQRLKKAASGSPS